MSTGTPTATSTPQSDTVRHEETQTGGASQASSVSTSSALTAVDGDLYLAAVNAEVNSVSGLGLTWTRVGAQCSGAGHSDVEVWMAQGTPSGDAVVTAALANTVNAVIAVSRYSGVDSVEPVGNAVLGNTNGVDGGCRDGTESATYAVDLTTTVDGALVYGAVAQRDEAHTPGSAYTERADATQTDANGRGAQSLAVQDRSVSTAGTVAVEGSFDGTADWAVIGVELRPASGTAATYEDGPSQMHKPVLGLAARVSAVPAEPSSGTIWRSYYYAGGQRVAMRERHAGDDQLVFLLGDHLGSTAVTADEDGSTLGELRYTAWGETRYEAGTTPTTFRYTGQRHALGRAVLGGADGLYFYRSRWYDPQVGRFALREPDTIVPEPGNPLAFDRYAYVYNNPLRYTDPTGRCIPEECPGTPQVDEPTDPSDLRNEDYAAWLANYILWLDRERAATGRTLDIELAQRSAAMELAPFLMVFGTLSRNVAVHGCQRI